MHTLEWMMAFSTLLATLALLAHPLSGLHTTLNEKTAELETKFHQLECSQRFESAESHFALILAGDCMFYPYLLHTPPDPFTLAWGEDSNHYD